MTCMVMRDKSTISYEWYKDGNPLESEGNVNIVSSDMFSTLIIKPVEETSFGNYTCVAKSSFGYDRLSAFLFVRGNCIPYSFITTLWNSLYIFFQSIETDFMS